MLLAKKDITRLTKKGYKKNFFVKYDKKGYAQLRNTKGYCVFYNATNHLCTVYADRPSGCRVYPVLLDEEKGITLDHICPQTDSVNSLEKTTKGKKVIRLLKIIDKEAASRTVKKPR